MLMRGIKIGERLVGEQPFRFARQHTGEQDTRPLAP